MLSQSPLVVCSVWNLFDCRHEELLSINDGVYAAMWTQQQTKLAEEEQRSKMSDADVADSPVTSDSVNRPGQGHGHGHGHGHH